MRARVAEQDGPKDLIDPRLGLRMFGRERTGGRHALSNRSAIRRRTCVNTTVCIRYSWACR